MTGRRGRRRRKLLDEHVFEHFLYIYFVMFAGVGYGRFMALCFGFNLLTYIQNRW